MSRVGSILRVANALFVGATLFVCLAGAAVAMSAAPRGGQERLSGIAISDPGNDARIPRRDLDCAIQATNNPSETCRATIAGKALRVEVTYYTPTAPDRPPRWGFRECTAFYGTRTAPCRTGNFTVSGPPYALLSGAELGLDDRALRAIRR